MDRGAWWATVHGVTKSPSQLKQLSMHLAHTHTHTGCLHSVPETCQACSPLKVFASLSCWEHSSPGCLHGYHPPLLQVLTRLLPSEDTRLP